ncbi:MAG: MFS transporter [Candidatus Bathyarchaeota archaeon]|nr:MAG: MFS transporter [Candidatus Bathyarchaeota archaeon]
MKLTDEVQRILHELPELGTMLVITFFTFFGFSSGEMLVPLYTQFLNVNPDSVGMLFFVSNLVSALVRIPAGIASDRYGRKPIVFIAAGSFIAASGLFFIAQDHTTLILPFVLWGAAGGFYFTSTTVLIADLSTEDNRVVAFARVGIINMLANMLGPLATGVLADRVGIATTFLILVTTFIAMALFVLRIQEAPRDANRDLSRMKIMKLLQGTAGPIIFAFTIFHFIFGIYGGMYWPAMTIIQKNLFQLTYSEIGLVSTVSMCAQLVGFMLCDRMAKYSSRIVLFVATLMLMSVALIYPELHHLGLLFPATVVSGFGFAFGILSPIGSTLFMNVLPPSTRGVSQGFIGTFWRLGMATGALLMGYIWNAININMIFYVSGGLMLVEAVIIIILLPRVSCS